MLQPPKRQQPPAILHVAEKKKRQKLFPFDYLYFCSWLHCAHAANCGHLAPFFFFVTRAGRPDHCNTGLAACMPILTHFGPLRHTPLHAVILPPLSLLPQQVHALETKTRSRLLRLRLPVTQQILRPGNEGPTLCCCAWHLASPLAIDACPGARGLLTGLAAWRAAGTQSASISSASRVLHDAWLAGLAVAQAASAA